MLNELDAACSRQLLRAAELPRVPGAAVAASDRITAAINLHNSPSRT
jgi:hypothetical protein